jgi:uncharacterized protein YbcI
MAESDTKHEVSGVDRVAIQREIVQLHKQFFGRGPIRTKLYLHQDSVLVLMFEGHTASEETLHQSGGARAVAQARVQLAEGMKQPFIAVIERYTGRKVVGFMSSSQQHPDLLSHVYVLEPTDLLAPIEGEGAAPPSL